MPIIRSLKSIFFVLPLVFSAASYAAEAAKTQELARVAIFEFQDNTGQQNYGWVKTSLPDAINDSMKTHFEFVRADAAAAQKKTEKAGTPTPLTPEAVSQLAGQHGFDIVIYGDYSYNRSTKLAQINATVYHNGGKRIIGAVTEFTKLNNDVFTKIDVISKKITEHIYRYSLDLTEKDALKKREEGIRLLVLVPTWTNEAEKKTAIGELEVQKKELKKKYDAEFITIFEFFKKKQTPAADQKNIELLAKSRNDAAIAEWLKAQKVSNAMIVFVSDNKVSLRPVVEGVQKAPVSYAINASAADKAKSIDAAVTGSGMQQSLQKTTITRKPPVVGRLSLSLGAFNLRPVGTGSAQINSSFGFEAQVLGRFLNLWVFQLGAAGSLHGTIQKHTRTDGDDDFTLRHYTALAGPAIIVPMPFYRPLEFHFVVLGGATYSQLDKYKYVDTTLTFKSVNPAASAQAEVRWHIIRFFFVGAAASYHQIFFPGTDMQYININLRAGLRF